MLALVLPVKNILKFFEYRTFKKCKHPTDVKAGFHISEQSQTIGDFTVSRPSQILLIYWQNLGSESSGSTMTETVFICEGQGKMEDW